MTFDGVWKCTMKTPMGPQTLTLTLNAKGEALTGSVSGQGMDTAIEAGRSTGDKATWKVKLTKPVPVTLEFNVTLSDGGLAGKVKFGMFGSGDLTGTPA
jgi:hypothetical protein